MSLVVGSGMDTAPRRRRRWPWVLVALLVAAALAAAMFALGRSSGEDTSSGDAGERGGQSDTARPSLQGPLGPVTWRERNGQAVPESDRHGPHNAVDATGYSHTEPGAVIAAINLAMQQSGTARPEARPSEYSYRILAGDPSGDLVQVSILARTPQTTQQGGQARIDLTLRWQGGDWQLQETAPPQIATDTTGYTRIPRGG